MSNIIADLTTAQQKAYSELAPNQKRKYTNLRKNDATHRVAIMAARKLEAKAATPKAEPKGAPKTPKAPKTPVVKKPTSETKVPWYKMERRLRTAGKARGTWPTNGARVPGVTLLELRREDTNKVDQCIVVNSDGDVLGRVYRQATSAGRYVFTAQAVAGAKSDNPDLRNTTIRGAIQMVVDKVEAGTWESKAKLFTTDDIARGYIEAPATNSKATKKSEAPAAKATKRRSELKAKAYGEANPESCELDEAPEVTRLKAALSKPVETMHCGICDDKRVVKGESSLQVSDVDGKPVTIRFRVLGCGHNQA